MIPFIGLGTAPFLGFIVMQILISCALITFGFPRLGNFPVGGSGIPLAEKHRFPFIVDMLTLLLLVPQACSANAKEIVAKPSNLSGFLISHDPVEF